MYPANIFISMMYSFLPKIILIKSEKITCVAWLGRDYIVSINIGCVFIPNWWSIRFFSVDVDLKQRRFKPMNKQAVSVDFLVLYVYVRKIEIVIMWSILIIVLLSLFMFVIIFMFVITNSIIDIQCVKISI